MYPIYTDLIRIASKKWGGPSTRLHLPHARGAPGLVRSAHPIDELGQDDADVLACAGGDFAKIFVGDVHVGGYDDMMAPHRAGQLLPLLGGQAPSA